MVIAFIIQHHDNHGILKICNEHAYLCFNANLWQNFSLRGIRYIFTYTTNFCHSIYIGLITFLTFFNVFLTGFLFFFPRLEGMYSQMMKSLEERRASSPGGGGGGAGGEGARSRTRRRWSIGSSDTSSMHRHHHHHHHHQHGHKEHHGSGGSRHSRVAAAGDSDGSWIDGKNGR